MVEETVLLSLVKSLDIEKSAAAAATALTAIFERAEPTAPLAALMAGMVTQLVTNDGKQQALSILQPYAPNVPECVNMAVDLSHDEDWTLRRSAASFLAAIPTNVKARSTLYEMLKDPQPDVANVAIAAVGKMDHTSGPSGAATALYVISDDSQREEALKILDDLQRAVNLLQELADLTPGQDEIVNKLILPDIAELKGLFGTEYEDWDQVVPDRKRSLITVGGAFRAAEALVLSVTGMANVDEAAANVTKTIQLLTPIAEAIKNSI